jgi:hypothetical protein
MSSKNLFWDPLLNSRLHPGYQARTTYRVPNLDVLATYVYDP